MVRPHVEPTSHVIYLVSSNIYNEDGRMYLCAFAYVNSVVTYCRLGIQSAELYLWLASVLWGKRVTPYVLVKTRLTSSIRLDAPRRYTWIWAQRWAVPVIDDPEGRVRECVSMKQLARTQSDTVPEIRTRLNYKKTSNGGYSRASSPWNWTFLSSSKEGGASAIRIKLGRRADDGLLENYGSRNAMEKLQNHSLCHIVT